MPTSTTYPDFTTGIVSLTNFSVTETDIGSVFAFIGTPPAITAQVDGYGAATAQFSSFEYGASRPGSSELVTMSYHATTNASGVLINSIDASMVVDLNTGKFANTTNTLTFTEQAFDAAGNLLATLTMDLMHISAAPVYFAQAQSDITISVTLNAAIGLDASTRPTSAVGGIIGSVLTHYDP